MKATNKFNVPKKQWGKWSKTGRIVFNMVMDQGDQEFIIPSGTKSTWAKYPKTPCISPSHWKAIRWNFAWIAASAADEYWVSVED